MNRLSFFKGVTSAGILAAALCVPHQASAEDIPAPQAPFLKPPAERATWEIISTTKPAADTDKSKFVVQVKAAQVDKLRREIITLADGASKEAWFLGDLYLYENPPGQVNVIDLARFPDAYSSRFTFKTLDWISPRSYVGVEKKNGVPCYHYKRPAGDVSPEEAIGSGFASVFGEAWINVETKQLVFFSDGSQDYSLSYGPSPSTAPVLPAPFAAALQRFRDDMNPLKIRRPPST